MGQASVKGAGSPEPIGKAKQAVVGLGSAYSGDSLNNVDDSFTSTNFHRGDEKIGILAFEVSIVITKALNLRQVMLEKDMRLYEAAIMSEGVRQLVSQNPEVLWRIAEADKKAELYIFYQEVVRLGKLCSDPSFHWLERGFENTKETTTPPAPQLGPEEFKRRLAVVEDLVTNTDVLYHELQALQMLEGTLKMKAKKEEEGEGEVEEQEEEDKNIEALQQEVEQQRKMVRLLKRRSLWCENLAWVMELLVDVAYKSNKYIVDTFGEKIRACGREKKTFPSFSSAQPPPLPPPAPLSNSFDEPFLGTTGMALHYANIIQAIDSIAARPSAVASVARDSLYKMLPNAIKNALRAKLLRDYALENEDISSLKDRIDYKLDWLLPMARNTIKYASQRRSPGYLQGHTELLLLQTLHHAKQKDTERVILELIIELHHLVSKIKTSSVW